MAKTEYDVDDILPLVGEFSRFQIIIEVLFCIIMIPQSLQNLIMYFAGLNSPWRCAASSSVCTFPRNLTFDSESKQYKARCSMNRSDWEFVQSYDYSIVTQVSGSIFNFKFNIISNSNFFRNLQKCAFSCKKVV